VEPQNGRQLGLEMIESEQPDIVFMDIHMPIMDGMEAITQLREKFSLDELPVIALTADAFKQQQEEMLNCGFNDYIIKPISPILIKYLQIEKPNVVENQKVQTAY